MRDKLQSLAARRGTEAVITGAPRKRLDGKPSRGFESHPLRQLLPFGQSLSSRLCSGQPRHRCATPRAGSNPTPVVRQGRRLVAIGAPRLGFPHIEQQCCLYPQSVAVELQFDGGRCSLRFVRAAAWSPSALCASAPDPTRTPAGSPHVVDALATVRARSIRSRRTCPTVSAASLRGASAAASSASGGEIRRAEPRQGRQRERRVGSVQFSSFRSRTRSNSAMLLVTNVTPNALACAAMKRSLAPIMTPRRFRSARISA